MIARVGTKPAGWLTSKVGFEATVKARLGWRGLTADEYVENGYAAFLSTPNIKRREIDFINVNYITKERYEESPEIALQIGDVLLTKDGFTLGTVNVVRHLPGPATVNGSNAVIRPHGRLDSVYLYYYLLSYPFQYLVHLMKDGMDILHLFQRDLRWFDILIPPLATQKVIADFLDRKTAAIDSLIVKKQRLLVLLAEKRATLINQAVTKGLDPRVPMKDSGIPWIGEIPAHWEVKRLKQALGSSQASGIQMGPFGASLTNVEREPTAYCVFGQANTISGDFGTVSRWLTATQYGELSQYALTGDDIVLTRKGSLGNCRLIPQGVPVGIMDSDTIRIRLDGNVLLPRYLVRLMHEAPYLHMQIRLHSRGAVLPGLNTTVVGNLRLALPPLEEQRRIISGLDSSLATLDALETTVTLHIKRLQEYRQALITAAVTGQIDITDEAV